MKREGTICIILLSLLLCQQAMSINVWKDGVVHWHHATVGQVLNGNPTQDLSTGYSDTLQIDSLDDFYFLSVFDGSQTEGEKAIWRIEKSDSTELIHTTSRLSDLRGIQYMNYATKVTEPQIYTYRHAGKPAVGGRSGRRLIVGGRPSESIPIDTPSGRMAEYLLIRRTLSPLELGMVESYLSIKYGISLSRMSSYYTATGKEVWNPYRESGYNSHVIGMGVDSTSHLSQSATVNASDSTLRLTCSNLRQGDYLLVGDNGQQALFERSGGRSELRRKWKVCQHPSGVVHTCGLEFSIGQNVTSSTLVVSHSDGTSDSIQSGQGIRFAGVPLRDGDVLSLQSVGETEPSAPQDYIRLSLSPNPVLAGEDCVASIRTQEVVKVRINVYSGDGRLLSSQVHGGSSSYDITLPMIEKGIKIIEAETRGISVREKLITK